MMRGTDRFKFPLVVIDEVIRTVKSHDLENFIVGYRFSPEEPEDGGITMEITESLIKQLREPFGLSSRITYGCSFSNTRR